MLGKIWKTLRSALDYLANVAGLFKAIYGAYAIWQMAQTLQMFNLLDPLKGKWVPLPQVGAVLTALWGVGIAQGKYRDRKEYPRRRLVPHAVGWAIGTVTLFALSLNLYYGLPEMWFIAWPQARWFGTMLLYWAFGAGLGVTVTLIELANSSRRNSPASRV